jgi:hypothetical protein
MNKLITLLAVPLFLALGIAQPDKYVPDTKHYLKFISFNIRLGSDWSKGQDGEYCWDNRKATVVRMIRQENPDAIGLQEVLPNQLAYLDSALSDYQRYGIGREDGKSQGEHMAIFLKKDRLELVKCGTYWLSQTPDSVSMGWDAGCHRTVTMGKPVGYLVDGALSREENLRLLMEARSQVGGNYLAGIASDETAPEREIDQLAETLAYAVENGYQQPKNFFGVGGLKIFRDLIYQMQGLMRADHRFYKVHGFYDDFPQKHRGRIGAMYLVGAMMKNKKLQKKIGGKMTEGMAMPYKKVLEAAEKQKD